jgi:AraC-like DNA-binding protein
MEGMGHVQHRSRSSLADNPRCHVQDRRFDRSQPFSLHAPLTRTRMKLLCYDPGDNFAYWLSAAGPRCKEPFGAETNPHESANAACRLRQAGSTRIGLAVWQQWVVAAYIEKHLAEPITVPALARFVHLSSQGFSGALKRSFGLPPHRYLVQKRIERAKALLASLACSITEIALALGFSQTSSFSARFRKLTGLSPTQYRRAC